MSFEIKTADELMDPALEARWLARKAARQGEILQAILRQFVEHGGPVRVAAIAGALPARAAEAVADAVRMLDAEDLIRVRDERIDIAYPFSAAPTAFRVRLEDGRERYACCAIDALGVAPMLGQRVRVGSACHHCGEPLAFGASPAGPDARAEGVLVWVAPRADGERRLATSL